MPTVRSPSVAGLFYPADPETLARWIDQALADARPTGPGPSFKAAIAPHAGYVYSGRVAATVYAALRDRAEPIRRIVLLGPAHRLGFAGIAVPAADSLLTPLGGVPVDRTAVDRVVDGTTVRVVDAAFDGEHCLEVQLPFVQRAFGPIPVVPLLVGQTTPDAVDQVLATLWGGPETVILVSSDLSHFHDDATARRRDRTTAQAIEGLRWDRLDGGGACGWLPIAGLLRRAGALDLRVTALDLRTSADSVGPPDRVVGYGAFGFEYAAGARLPAPLRRALRDAAGAALAHAAETDQPPAIDVTDVPLALQALRASFVTLDQPTGLRGCIGSLAAHRPLISDVVTNTVKAARHDPRFGPVRPEEVADLTITLSILSHPRPVPFDSEDELIEALHPDVDGVILRIGDRHGVFLPKVWQTLPQPADFVRHLKTKAGVAVDHPLTGATALRFTVESF